MIGMMAAALEAIKLSLSFLPNIELVSLFIILFALYFKEKTYYAIIVFVVLEGLLYGFGVWWISYMYAWPFLAFITRRFRGMKSPVFWAVVSGLFGLSFGLLFAIPYIFIGGPALAVTSWISGIPWDLVHGVSNFILMVVLYRPLTYVLKRLTYV